MTFQWKIFLAALGLAFILESLPYFMAPEGVKRLVRSLLEFSPSALRFFGLAGILAGLALVALSRILG